MVDHAILSTIRMVSFRIAGLQLSVQKTRPGSLFRRRGLVLIWMFLLCASVKGRVACDWGHLFKLQH